MILCGPALVLVVVAVVVMLILHISHVAIFFPTLSAVYDKPSVIVLSHSEEQNQDYCCSTAAVYMYKLNSSAVGPSVVNPE